MLVSGHPSGQGQAVGQDVLRQPDPSSPGDMAPRVEGPSTTQSYPVLRQTQRGPCSTRDLQTRGYPTAPSSFLPTTATPHEPLPGLDGLHMPAACSARRLLGPADSLEMGLCRELFLSGGSSNMTPTRLLPAVRWQP